MSRSHPTSKLQLRTPEMPLPSRTSLFGSCLPFVAWLWLLTSLIVALGGSVGRRHGLDCTAASSTGAVQVSAQWGVRVQQSLPLSLVQVEMVGQLPHSTGEWIFIAVYSALGDFFRPTPSWLPPGRYTCSIAAKR